MRCLPCPALEIVGKHLAIHRVSAVIYDFVCTFHRVLVAKIGDTLVGNKDIYRVFAVVGVGNHRHDIADSASLGDRRTAEYRYVGIAGKVARAADTVHHLCAENVGGVHAAEKVGFERRIHGNDTYSAYNFGIVRYLGRTHQNLVVEEAHVGEELFFGLVRECHRACAGKGTFAFFKQLENSVLYNFGIHHEVRQLLALAEVVEHGIGDIAHARLQRQELLGQTARLVLAHEEVDHIAANLVGNFVGSGERLHAVIGVSVHYAHDFGGIDLQHGAAHAVVRGIDRYFATTRRIERHIYIVHAEQRLGQLGVKLDEDFLASMA